MDKLAETGLVDIIIHCNTESKQLLKQTIIGELSGGRPN